MNLHPTEDRVVIRPLDKDSVTPGGIVIPDNAKEKSQKGEIMGVGPGKVSMETVREKNGVVEAAVLPMTIKVGQTVIFSRYGGAEVEEGGETYVIMRETDVLAVVAP